MTGYGYMEREQQYSMDFGNLRAALYDDEDCHGTITADTNLLFIGETAVSSTITTSAPVAVIEIDGDTSSDSKTSRVLTGLKVCFPIDAVGMDITKTQVCTATFSVQ